MGHRKNKTGKPIIIKKLEKFKVGDNISKYTLESGTECYPMIDTKIYSNKEHLTIMTCHLDRVEILIKVSDRHIFDKMLDSLLSIEI